MVLGILGGLGPMAGAYFYELLINHTKAVRDQDHIDVVLSGRASTPDRTAFITGASFENPLEQMIADANRLTIYGADVIAMPCNTAHYLYEKLSQSIAVPLINIIDVTVRAALNCGCQKVGIMATEGTVMAKVYQKYCDELGLACAVPRPDGQEMLNRIIYDDIKAGRAPNMESFFKVKDELVLEGCDRIILGCTELSLIGHDYNLGGLYIDSLSELAFAAIKYCGREVIL